MTLSTTTFYVIAAIVGYLAGSIPFGLILTKIAGAGDIRAIGSGNIGATNVLRTGRKGLAAGTLLLDGLKGVAVVLLGATQSVDIAAIAGLAAVIGHNFPVWLKFKGGKGVATAAGGVLVLVPVSCLIGAAVWVVTFYATRYVSLGSILAAVAVPVASWLRGNPIYLNVVVTALGLFVIIRHRENIKRLMNGTENKFAKKPPEQG